MELTEREALDSLAFGPEKELYYAAAPGYMRNFSRDSLLYGLISGDSASLIRQIEYSAVHQGKNISPDNGEEPGKIHHELPGGEFRGRPTTYNACDTNALFLISIARLAELGIKNTLSEHRESINDAIGYILRHTEDDLFFEDPRKANSEKFSLRVTYWKDSVLNGPYPEPKYPIVYSLVHFQNSYALQQIGKALNSPEIEKQGTRMKSAGLRTLWKKDHFITAIDNGETEFDAPSSDSLHSLLYIEPDEISSEAVQAIEAYSSQLETPAGYMPCVVQTDNPDVYHTRFLWVFEQALLNAAALKHGLIKSAQVSRRVAPYISPNYPELLDSQENFTAAGNPIQLWSIAAAQYFKNPTASLIYPHIPEQQISHETKLVEQHY